jgi:phosphoribosylformylglycinamidine synthase II
VTSSPPAAATRAFPFPGERPVTPEVVREHNLNELEFERIVDILGRTPTLTELGVFSALWSEHCSYKHSKPILKTFPTTGDRVIQGPGENAGVLRLEDGWAVAFKIESHNHPSAVEPYQGAATGAGGILRDVFTMGARPVAMLNSLRFGPLDDPRNRYLFAGVVRGIGDYGNCVGVPTLGGEVDFAPGYSGNPLVNAMCVGLLKEKDLITARAHGVGNLLLAVGARTGRDGIHGASFASEELSEKSEARRPQVQVGDPFTEKLLLEATLELISSRVIVAIQDMGAAGLTSSSAEMAARGGVGVEIETDRVPVREADMTPYEILLSESQERMLVVAEPEQLKQVQAICAKWELTAMPIGKVTDDGMFRIRHNGTVVAEIPGQRLVEDCPIYTPEAAESEEVRRRRSGGPADKRTDFASVLEQLLDTPSIASKRWVYEQYDSTVQGASAIMPGGDAGVIRVADTNFALAVTVDCNARLLALDPYEGARHAVAEAARNVAVTGAVPIGITDCLNFGSPEKPEVFFQFKEACRGIGDACRAFGIPVTGGNVSFYNESPTGAIDPTPTIGLVGLLGRIEDRVTSHFAAAGDRIVLLGTTEPDSLGGSAYWAEALGFIGGQPTMVDLKAERALQLLLVQAAERHLFRSAHDCSTGGLAVALAEAAVRGPYHAAGLGALVDLTGYCDEVSDEALLFGESGARAVVTVTPEKEAELLAMARHAGVPAVSVGVVGNESGPFTVNRGRPLISRAIDELRQIYFDAIPRRMQQPEGGKTVRR